MEGIKSDREEGVELSGVSIREDRRDRRDRRERR